MESAIKCGRLELSGIGTCLCTASRKCGPSDVANPSETSFQSLTFRLGTRRSTPTRSTSRRRPARGPIKAVVAWSTPCSKRHGTCPRLVGSRRITPDLPTAMSNGSTRRRPSRNCMDLTINGDLGEPVVNRGDAGSVVVANDRLDSSNPVFEQVPPLREFLSMLLDAYQEVAHHIGIAQVALNQLRMQAKQASRLIHFEFGGRGNGCRGIRRERPASTYPSRSENIGKIVNERLQHVLAHWRWAVIEDLNV